MNELIIIGIVILIMLALIGVTAIVENWSVIWKRICKAAFRIRLRFWCIQTAYYKFKLDQRRRRYYQWK